VHLVECGKGTGAGGHPPARPAAGGLRGVGVEAKAFPLPEVVVVTIERTMACMEKKAHVRVEFLHFHSWLRVAATLSEA
jgi:hypothetical protein